MSNQNDAAQLGAAMNDRVALELGHAHLARIELQVRGQAQAEQLARTMQEMEGMQAQLADMRAKLSGTTEEQKV